MRGDENTDLLSALCRRIAFAALRDTDENATDFSRFRKAAIVRKDDIVDWLRDKDCILVIDELNVGTEDADSVQLKLLYRFLKLNFVIYSGHYFVFSSHVVSTVGDLSDYLDACSHRQIITVELPLIPDLTTACMVLRLRHSVSVLATLYKGLIPSLLLERDKN
jgi:hypothetical protein